jgi:hypothetical protein
MGSLSIPDDHCLIVPKVFPLWRQSSQVEHLFGG